MRPARPSAKNGRRPVAVLVVLMGLTAACVIQAYAQDAATPPAAYLWSGTVGFGRTSNAMGAAGEQSMTLRRVTDRGPVALEALQFRRLGQNDRAWALDAYPRLWDGAYSNVRLDRKSTRLNSSHVSESRMPSSA